MSPLPKVPARIIPIAPDDPPQAVQGAPSPASWPGATPHARTGLPGPLRDQLGRPLTDLRISVTDRCNFRCTYCMPRSAFGPGHRFMPPSQLLSFEEITRVAAVFTGLGVHTLRLTGGEPLMRKDLERLVEMLHALASPGQPLDLAMTTNAALLGRKARALKAAGLGRVTVSLDALEPALFRQMSDSDTTVRQVLDGIEAARAAGLGPVKVNTVVRRGVNEDQIMPLARHFASTGVELRFIEYMDVGGSNGWRPTEVFSAEEIRAVLHQGFDLAPLPRQAGDTAQRYQDRRTGAVFGLIASITAPFCGGCSRLRLSSDGTLHTCLFSTRGHPLREALRRRDSDEQLAAAIAALWSARADRYSERRGSPQASARAAGLQRIEMSYIGG